MASAGISSVARTTPAASSSRPGPVSSVSAEPSTSSKSEIVFSTADTALAILKEVGEMTQNIPYIKAVSGICIQILKIKSEVDLFRDKWKIVMADVERIRELIDDYYDQVAAAPQQEQKIPKDLQRAFKALEENLQTTLVTLKRCQPQRKRDHVLLFLNRVQLTTAIDDCGRGMQNALHLFNAKLNFGSRTDTARIWDAISRKVKILPIEDTVTVPDLRPPPETLFGRETEMLKIVTGILKRTPPARIAIIGPRGIGKTSLALSALHHPDIASEFPNTRYFVPCGAAETPGDLLLQMATALGIFDDGALPLEKKILASLRSVDSCVVCLDGFEKPWEKDTQTREVEELLAKVASIPSVAVIVTMRGTERPAKTRWTPFLDPLTPLSLDAALQTFEAISGKRDEVATRLVQAMGCVPLDVHALARLAQSEETSQIWARWEVEGTSMLDREAVRHVEH
ncbi:hypothetical protein EVG20_g2164 [Dentipellis fragilis]|uniref:NACHT domain-containing protein n=1 Tax=Dentipellis fragilis TaxID=205917 RepID=A0A4Y9ZAL7_9AGAM|nr:hypothetical protein EVG20_g2164 [Dentipellis fragilis]